MYAVSSETVIVSNETLNSLAISHGIRLCSYCNSNTRLTNRSKKCPFNPTNNQIQQV